MAKMADSNPLLTSPDEPFVVGETDLVFLDDSVWRGQSEVVLFCRKGSAEIMIDRYRVKLQRNMLVLVLAGWMLKIVDRTTDFRVSYCAFSHDLFSEAAFRFEPAFFHKLHENPLFYPSESDMEWIRSGYRMAEYTYRNRKNIFRNTIIRNLLQNMLFGIYDKMQRETPVADEDQKSSTRRTELFQRFVSLVHEYCPREREVAFYADKLCISTRYLSTIVRTIARCSAKEFIDRAVVLEIKMLIESTDLSFQEIAFRLHFPDQSYLGRYFKKHTGESPTEYRNTRK